MTNLDPKHLDALVDALRGGEQADMDGCMVKVSRQACEEAADTITAMRAQIDRERAATIEAAGLAVADTEIGYYDGISGDWRAYTGPVILSKACASIRALHTDTTRAAMDAIQKEQGPFPASWWGEDDGDVLWWCWRDGEWLGEAPYVGTPLDLGYTVELHARDAQHKMHRMNVGGWPGYHTHWTRLQETPPAPRSFA